MLDKLTTLYLCYVSFLRSTNSLCQAVCFMCRWGFTANDKTLLNSTPTLRLPWLPWPHKWHQLATKETSATPPGGQPHWSTQDTHKVNI